MLLMEFSYPDPEFVEEFTVKDPGSVPIKYVVKLDSETVFP
jgi:hypothetical protein